MSRHRYTKTRHKRPVHGHLLRVSLSELGRKDESFDTLEDALADLRARYPQVRVSAWSKVRHTDHFGEPISYRVAKWSRQGNPRTRTDWASKYDGKLAVYYTSEADESARRAFRRRAFEVP